MQDDQSQKNNTKKLVPSSEDQQKKESKSCIISKLIIVVCCSIIAFVGINFINCSFMIPGSIERSYVLGGLKKTPSLDCEEAQNGGYNALITLLTAVIALKTKLD